MALVNFSFDDEAFVWCCRFHGIKGADEFTTWLYEFAEPVAKAEMTQMRAATIAAFRQGDRQRAHELAQHTLSRWTVHVLRPLARHGRKMQRGRKAGAKEPLQRWIDKKIDERSHLQPTDLWSELRVEVTRPRSLVRGYECFEEPVKYIRRPTRDNKGDISWKTFQNKVATAKRQAKVPD